MDKELVRWWRDRWKAVEDIERAEMRTATADEKLRQMEAITSILTGIGVSFERPDAEIEEVRRRWLKLKGID